VVPLPQVVSDADMSSSDARIAHASGTSDCSEHCQYIAHPIRSSEGGKSFGEKRGGGLNSGSADVLCATRFLSSQKQIT
jgi:hypothetical protein